jgi:hypothetical protein
MQPIPPKNTSVNLPMGKILSGLGGTRTTSRPKTSTRSKPT